MEETLEIGGKHGGGKARGWSEMAYNKLPNAMQSVGLGQDLFRAAKKDPQLASTLKEAAVGYWKKAKGIPEPGAFPADPATAAAAAPASAAVESKSRLRGQGRAREPLKRHPEAKGGSGRIKNRCSKNGTTDQGQQPPYGTMLYSRSPTHTMCSA